MEPPDRQKAKAQEILKQAPECAFVFYEISKVFIREGNLQKALKFANQAVTLDPSNKDFQRQLEACKVESNPTK